MHNLYNFTLIIFIFISKLIKTFVIYSDILKLSHYPRVETSIQIQ